MPEYTTGTASTDPYANLPRSVRDYMANGASDHRNDHLLWAACQFRDAGYSREQTEPLLTARAMEDGLGAEEITKTIKSAYDRAPRAPATGSGGGTAPPISSSPKSSSPPPNPRASVPLPLPSPIPGGFKVLLEVCFLSGEQVALGKGKYDTDGVLQVDRSITNKRDAWLRRIAAKTLSEMYPKEVDGLFLKINPMNGKGLHDVDVLIFRHRLVEFDMDDATLHPPKELQFAWLIESKLPISVIIDSGKRSIQAAVLLDAPDRKEYDRRTKLVNDYFSSFPGFDPKTFNPSRYFRCPGAVRNLYDDQRRLIGTARQELLAVKAGMASWEEWEKSQGGVAGTDYTDDELDELTRKRNDYYKVKDHDFPQPMGDAAFCGVLGDIIKIIEPHSEACREAIITQILVGFGCLLGRGPHRRQGAVHHLNEFTVLVGETSLGRKGTAWAIGENLFSVLDRDWITNRVKDGMPSGESIITAVRDPRTIMTKAGQKHDPGISDKRLMIMEEEFAHLLTVANRQSNTLFSILRKVWDGKKWLHSEGKISPEKATGAHVSMIGHVTRTELLSCLSKIENENGFSNRILWVATYQSKTVPVPLWIEWTQYPEILKELISIVSAFKNYQTELQWSVEARLQWSEYYHKPIEGSKSGIVGSIIARTAAHLLRLTMIYAVLDRSTLMEPEHLNAAIAFWEYCRRSAEWTFSEKTGNKTADLIYWALRREPGGMTRNEIREDVFAGHCPKITMDMAFAVLINGGLAWMKLERSGRGTRPTERWFSTEQSRNHA